MRSKKISNDEPLIQSSDESANGSFGNILCDPNRLVYRYIGLFFICCVNFGTYFCYDNPAALQDNFKNDLKISTATFAGFYSWYAWPNVILCYFGGYIIDKFLGIRLGAIVFAGISMSGDMLFALGAYLNKIWLMNAGRLVFGIGGESLNVAMHAYTVSWFAGKELNFVFGIQLSLGRLGSSISMNMMTPIYNQINKSLGGYQCLGLTLFIAGSFTVLSFTAALVLFFLDKRRERLGTVTAVRAGDKIKIKDIIKFPIQHWLIILICLAFYGSLFPFISLAKVYYISKYDLSSAKASETNSVIYLVSAITSPILGFMIDFSGFNTLWVAASILLTIVSTALLTFTFTQPIITTVAIGISYSLLASALWPMVAMIIPKHRLGTAYGLMLSMQNLILAVFSILAGLAIDAYGYFILLLCVLFVLCIGLACSLVLYFVDINQEGGILSISRKKRLEKQKTDTE